MSEGDQFLQVSSQPEKTAKFSRYLSVKMLRPNLLPMSQYPPENSNISRSLLRKGTLPF